MQLVLNSFGGSISKSGEMFEVQLEGRRQKVSTLKVSSILIAPGVSLSSDAIELALRNNIDILMLSKYGDPVGRFWHARMGSTARIRRAQLRLTLSPDGLKYGAAWLIAKLNNEINLLKKMQTRRTRLFTEIGQSIGSMKNSLARLRQLDGTIDDIRNTILGIEGACGRIYWDIMAQLVPVHFKFQGRSRNPAKDEFNAILNYGYGMLYGLVEKAVVIAGLDPYIGFIHTDNYNKISLVFDVIEKYRIWVEETLLDLFAKKKIAKGLFKELSNGFYLDDEGKKLFIPAFNEFLDGQIRYNNRNTRRRDVIQLDLHAFAQDLLGRFDED